MKSSVFVGCAIALVAIAGCNSKQGQAATNAAAKRAHATAPKTRDWTQVVSPTAAGGFVMGNPNAKVKLIEFGSLTCPHCKHFDDEGVPHLLGYVKSGQVSWEFRNYVRDAFDVTAALIARCNGAKDFFPLTRAIYKEQPDWEAKIEATPQDQLKSMQDLPTNQEFVALAKVAAFAKLAAEHGLPPAKANQCLASEKSADQLVQMAENATTQFPDFPGTPTFVINGKMVPNVATWDGLEPALKKALGERG